MFRICRLHPVYNVLSIRQDLALPALKTTLYKLYTTRNTLDFTGKSEELPTSRPVPSLHVDERKYPSRGGQNLTQRFQRLERSFRGKDAYKQEITELKEDAEGTTVDLATEDTQKSIQGRKNKAQMFMGFVIPDEPKPPADDGMISFSTLS